MVPGAKTCPLVGAVRLTVGGVLAGPPCTVKVTEWLALNDGVPLSNAVAWAVCVPAVRVPVLNVVP